MGYLEWNLTETIIHTFRFFNSVIEIFKYRILKLYIHYVYINASEMNNGINIAKPNNSKNYISDKSDMKKIHDKNIFIN